MVHSDPTYRAQYTDVAHAGAVAALSARFRMLSSLLGKNHTLRKSMQIEIDVIRAGLARLKFESDNLYDAR